jgi:hypothetical protein
VLALRKTNTIGLWRRFHYTSGRDLMAARERSERCGADLDLLGPCNRPDVVFDSAPLFGCQFPELKV